MATIREIPGYYYDEERRRYFKIVNGAIPSNSSSPATPSSSSSSSQSVSRYHNNSIQAKQRYANHLAKTTTSTNTNKEIKRNKILKIPKLIIKNPNLSSSQLQYLQNLRSRFLIISMNSLILQ